MWKAPKARDDGVMPYGIVELLLVAQALEQLQRTQLVRQILAVFKRKIEEQAPFRRQFAVVTARQSRFGDLPRPFIGGEGLGTTTMDVPGELIQQQNQCQCTV